MQLSKTFCEVSLSMNTLVHLQNILCYSHWFVFTFLFIFAQSIRWFKLDNDEMLHLILFHVHADSRSLNIRQLLLKTFDSLKALANEDTLLLKMFLGLCKLGNICSVHKMFLNKIRNTFCAPHTNFMSATHVVCTGKRGNICVRNSVYATMCPRLPGA